ncbi:MAG: 2-C-methyl-D-erythritol 4-phosphate cytidylyltransferase, partial [Candidatus Sericytochromatia bacterium]
LIHDAARPDLPRPVISRLLAALEDHPGAIPVLPVVDSLAVAAGAIGILLAWVRYGSHATPRFAFPHNPLWNAASHKWFWDELYQNALVRPLVAFSRWGLWRGADNGLIDGFVNGVPRAYLGVSQLARHAQTGVVRLYAYAILAGVIGILAYVVFRFQLLRF